MTPHIIVIAGVSKNTAYNIIGDKMIVSLVARYKLEIEYDENTLELLVHFANNIRLVEFIAVINLYTGLVAEEFNNESKSN